MYILIAPNERRCCHIVGVYYCRLKVVPWLRHLVARLLQSARPLFTALRPKDRPRCEWEPGTEDHAFSTASFHTLFFYSSSTSIILVTSTNTPSTFDLLPCQSPTLNLTLSHCPGSPHSVHAISYVTTNLEFPVPVPAASHSATT